jgi:hypothetical protein
MSIMCRVDDKSVPLYRIMWISEVPHFCGSEECQHEGDYEVRLEQGEAVWADEQERERVIQALEAWQGGLGQADDEEHWDS